MTYSIDDDTGSGVGRVVGNIVVHHHDCKGRVAEVSNSLEVRSRGSNKNKNMVFRTDIGSVEAMAHKHLVRVAHISLVAVVAPAARVEKVVVSE